MNLHADHKKVNVCNVPSPPSGLRQRQVLKRLMMNVLIYPHQFGY